MWRQDDSINLQESQKYEANAMQVLFGDESTAFMSPWALLDCRTWDLQTLPRADLLLFALHFPDTVRDHVIAFIVTK